MVDNGGKRVLPFDRGVRAREDAGVRPAPDAGRGGVVVPGWTTLYQLQITLRDIDPPIWRRIRVPGTLDLASLHRVIQAAMGWAEPDDPGGSTEWISRTARTDEELPTDLDEGLSTLDSILKTPGDSFIYASGWGDEWVHVVTVEEIRRAPTSSARIACLDGARNCPPLDAEGPSGYADLIEALRDPLHEGHIEALESTPRRFDPERFDVDETNRRLARLAI